MELSQIMVLFILVFSWGGVGGEGELGEGGSGTAQPVSDCHVCPYLLLRELAAELQMCNNQRGFKPRHLSPWFPTKIRNNKNPFKAFNVFSHFLQFPPLPRCSWFLWHQNRSSLWKCSSSPLLFLEGARTTSQAQNAFVLGLWIVGGEEVEQLEPRAAVQDLLTRRLPGWGWMAGYLLFVHPGQGRQHILLLFPLQQL